MPSILKIAVVVVNWNAGDYLKKCLQCLKSQTLNPTRVIVVDNASTDGSVQAVEEEFNGCDLIRLKENTGFAFANNLAVKMAENAWFDVAKDPLESKYFLLIKIPMYLSVLSIIFVNLL